MLLVLKELLLKGWVWMKRCWAWSKENWQWIIFPVGIMGFLLVGRRVLDDNDLGVIPLPPDDDRTVVDIRNALAERDLLLEELKKEHAAKLRELSQQQAQELEELEAKPLDEVVAWFDKLSSP